VSYPLLPICPEAICGESPRGYYLRLAEENCYPTVAWLDHLGDLTCNLRSDHRSLVDLISKLALITARPELELRRILMSPEPLADRFINNELSKVCPICLKNQPILRRLWDIILICVCPLHGVFLVDSCPGCGAVLTFNRARVCYCKCGFDLRQATPRCAPSQIVHLAQVIAKASADPQVVTLPNDPQRQFPEEFYSLSLQHLALLVPFLGVLALRNNVKEYSRINKSMKRISSSISITTAASETLCNWPTAFHAVLTNIHKNRGYKNQGSLVKAFGYSYIYIYVNLRNPTFDFLRTAFEDYISANWLLLPHEIHKSFSPNAKAAFRYVSSLVATRRLHISWTHLQKLVRSGELPAIVRRTSTCRPVTLIRQSVIEAFEIKYSDRTTVLGAVDILGIPKKRVKELLKAGLIGTMHDINRHKEYKPWFIKKSDIEGLIKDLAPQSSAENTSQRHGRLITLTKILQHYLNQHGDFIAFIRAVKDKKILSRGRAKGFNGIAELLFDLSEVQRFQRIRSGFPEMFTTRECASKLDMSYHTTCRLLQAKLLKYKLVHVNHQRIRLVSQAEIVRFKRLYVLPKHLISIRRIAPKRIALVLTQARVPVKTRRVQGGKPIRLFSRQAALRALNLQNRA